MDRKAQLGEHLKAAIKGINESRTVELFGKTWQTFAVNYCTVDGSVELKLTPVFKPTESLALYRQWVGRIRRPVITEGYLPPLRYPLSMPEVTKPADELSPEALTAAVWSGEGRPPVGCVCEVIVDGGAPGRGLITYTAGNLVCWKWKGQADDEECCSYIHRLTFRPLRTAEQLAAEVREKAIAEMRKVAGQVPPWGDVWGALYDAGYRKEDA